MQTIPQNIHLVFFNSEQRLPEAFKYCYERIVNFHPDWNIQLYDRDKCETIIKANFDFLYPLYQSYPYDVQRADIIRIILVYLYGGFYLDLDMYCFKSFDDLLCNELVLAEEKTVSVKICKSLSLKSRLRISNYAFGGSKGHKFWLVFLKHAINLAFRNVLNENDILETTGPGLLTNVYQKHKKDFDILLLGNEKRECIMPGHSEYSCHFGEYAAHLHTGSWRWNNQDTFALLRDRNLNVDNAEACQNAINAIIALTNR